MHCLAGDATGIVIAAAIVPTFGLPNGIDLMIEYVSAFIVGLLVFQALMMVGMYGGDTFLLMLGAAWLATFAAPISFSRPMRGM